jgi:L-2-hydroxyglutarate oxidase LhgO
MEKVEIAIIGAGVVGLAVARELSKTHNVVVLEKNERFGAETSSRNSEVIHSGIYYPENSLKAELCVRGKELLYQFLEERRLPYKRCGKVIVAKDRKEVEGLHRLKAQGEKNGVSDLEILSKSKLKRLIPDIEGEEALFSPSSGVFDTHRFMESLEAEVREGGIISYCSEVVEIEKESCFKLTVREEDGRFCFLADVVINCAGLWSDKVSKMVGIDYELSYLKGEYFSLPKEYNFSVLIYPLPEKESLGIHIGADSAGRVKAGPNAFKVDRIDYSVNREHRGQFYEAVKRFFPNVKSSELMPDFSGIRPKLGSDFLIREEIPGFFNLVGIDSPGLTSALSIGEYVKRMVG